MRIVGSGFLVLLLFFVVTTHSFAQEVTPPEVSATPTPATIEYQLPFPGLLPDSPLYSLKTIRDRIIDFLISDPLKKSEFYLLQADKRLQGGVYLVDSGKHDLAESTISKGQNYFEDAIAQIKKAKQEGMDVVAPVGRLETSSKKHQEILKTLVKKAPDSLKTRFEALARRMAGFEKEVAALKAK